MGAVLTHVVIGVLVAAVAGVPTRYLPLAAVLAEVIDLDHMFSGPGPQIARAGGQPVWMMNRATFHNLWLVALIPAVIALVVYWRRMGSPGLRRLAVASPAILTSHTLFDMIELGTGHPFNGSFPFYPFSFQRRGLDLSALVQHPEYVDVLSVGLAIALTLGLAARLLVTAIEAQAGQDAGRQPVADEELTPERTADEGQDGDEGARGGEAPGEEVGNKPEVRRFEPTDPTAGAQASGEPDGWLDETEQRILRSVAYGLFFIVVVPVATWWISAPVPVPT